MYLALGESPPYFTQDFTSPVLLKNINCKGITPFAYRAVTVSGRPFQAVLLGKISFRNPCLLVQANNAYVYNTLIRAKSYNRHTTRDHRPFDPQPVTAFTALEFELVPVRSPLLGE